MCGRFTVTADGETIIAEFGLPEVPFDYRPRYNVAPTQPVLAVVADNDRKRAGWMRWGPLINARAETVEERQAFRDSFHKRRCLVIADGFYEWKQAAGIKIPMRITATDQPLFAFAGIWERKEGIVSCSILTTTPSPSIADIHDRMPVILTPDARDVWLDRDSDVDALKNVLQSYPDDALHAYAVESLVNNVDNDSAACIAPARYTPAEQTSLF